MPELKDSQRNCSECKKLIETEKGARNTRSCQKVAEQLVEPLSIPSPPHPLKCQMVDPLSWLSMYDRSSERSPG